MSQTQARGDTAATTNRPAGVGPTLIAQRRSR
jgi:hypothetical protein